MSIRIGLANLGARRAPAAWLRRQEGQTLPMVLIAMGVGIVLISGLLSAVDQRLTMVNDLPWKGEERYAADAGVEYAVWQLTNEPDFLDQFSEIGVTEGVALPNAINGLVPAVTVELITQTTAAAGTYGTLLAAGPRTNLNGVTFADSSNGWIVGSGGLILKTTDSGGAWLLSPSGTTRDLRAVSFPTVDRGWAVGSRGTIRYWNGSAWTTQTSGTTRNLRGVSFADTTHGWAVGDSGRIVASNGISWTIQDSGSGANLRAVTAKTTTTTTVAWAVGDPWGHHHHDHDDDDDHHHWGHSAAILYFNGTSWTTQDSGTDHSLYGVFFLDASRGWAVGNHGTIVRTTDGGAHWTAQTSGTGDDLYSVFFLDANQGWAAGEHGKILHTSNGGGTWTAQNDPDLRNKLNGIFMLNASLGFAVGDRFTLLAYGDLPENPGTLGWYDAGTPVTGGLYGVTSLDVNYSWTVGVPHSPYYANVLGTEGGQAWQPEAAGNDTLRAVAGTGTVAGPSTLWTVGDNESGRSTVFKSTNLGVTWQDQSGNIAPTTYNRLQGVFAVDASRAWAVGENGYVISTTDGGIHWSGRTWGSGWDSDHHEGLNDVYLTSATTGWSVGHNGAIFRTTNGITWTAQSSGTSHDLYGVWFTDASTGWAVGESGTVRKTTNGGDMWTTVTLTSTSATLYDIFFLPSDPRYGWIVGSSDVRLFTSDAGASWRAFGAPIGSYTWRGVWFSDACHGWVVGSGSSHGAIAGFQCAVADSTYEITSIVGEATTIARVKVTVGAAKPEILSWQVQ